MENRYYYYGQRTDTMVKVSFDVLVRNNRTESRTAHRVPVASRYHPDRLTIARITYRDGDSGIFSAMREISQTNFFLLVFL